LIYKIKHYPSFQISTETAPLVLKMEEDWGERAYCKAVYKSRTQQIEEDNKQLFMPSTALGMYWRF
jgi:hypothetical protein